MKTAVTRNEFIRAWESSENIQEVSDKTGLKKTSCQTRASKYRADGIPLKHFARAGRTKESIDSAIKLLAEIRGKAYYLYGSGCQNDS